jgi:DNA modification methylase
MTSARSPKIVRGRTRLCGSYPPRERRWEVRNDDCLKTLSKLQADSIDAIVTDPPYGLEFMGKEWDSFRSDDPGTNRNRGEHAGSHGTADGTSKGDYPARDKIAVTQLGRHRGQA